MSAPTSVYLYYDQTGRLIYVGITAQGPRRQGQHTKDAEWWPYVASQKVEHHATRDIALDRERELIQTNRPPFNRQHNPGWEQIRSAYLQVVAAERVFASAQAGALSGISPCGGHCWQCRTGDPSMCSFGPDQSPDDACPICEDPLCTYQLGARSRSIDDFANLCNARRYLVALGHDQDPQIAETASRALTGLAALTEQLGADGDVRIRSVGALISKYLLPNPVDRIIYSRVPRPLPVPGESGTVPGNHDQQ